MLMGMLFFIYAIIGMQLFGNLVFIFFFFTIIYIFKILYSNCMFR